MIEDLPEPLKQAASSTVLTVLLAWLGRLMWHVHEVQKQRRKFWSLHLVWEVVTAVCVAFVADGVAEFLGVDGKVKLGLIVAVAYLGPRGLESLVLNVLRAHYRRGDRG